jgi:hypothetical protein
VAGNSLFWHDDPHPSSGQRKQFPASIVGSRPSRVENDVEIANGAPRLS